MGGGDGDGAAAAIALMAELNVAASLAAAGGGPDADSKLLQPAVEEYEEAAFLREMSAPPEVHGEMERIAGIPGRSSPRKYFLPTLFFWSCMVYHGSAANICY